MKKKLTDKDKKDWNSFIVSKEKLENKDTIKDYNSENTIKKTIDLHGYTLEEANKKIFDFIINCFENGISKINVITGKGLRSKNLDDPYQSNKLSILKYAIPEFIKKNSDLIDKIVSIETDAVNSPLKGSFEIILKKKKIKLMNNLYY